MARLNRCARREDFFPPLPGRPRIAEGHVVLSATGTRPRETARGRTSQKGARANPKGQRANQACRRSLRAEPALASGAARYRKWYYRPRADRLRSSGDLAQVLLDFAQALEQEPICPDDMPPQAEPEYELRRVKRRKGRRALANFENLSVATKVYELSAEERACPCCGGRRTRTGRGGGR
jgi:hypothetical protein